jgi:PAS domain S-box-containing protein
MSQDLLKIIKKQQEKISQLEDKLQRTHKENRENVMNCETYRRSLDNNYDFLNLLFEESGWGLIQTDMDGFIIRINESIAHFTHYKKSELLTLNFSDLTQDPGNFNFCEFIQLKKNSVKHIIKILRKDKNPIWVKLTPIINYDIFNAPKSVFLLIEDYSISRESSKYRINLHYINKLARQTDDLNELFSVIQKKLGKIISSQDVFIKLFSNRLNQRTKKFNIHDEFMSSPNDQDTCFYNMLIDKSNPLILSQNDIQESLNSGTLKCSDAIPKSWIGVPLKSDSAIIGTLGVKNFIEENTYSNSELELFEFAAGTISSFIERKQFYEELNIGRSIFVRLFDNMPDAIAVINEQGMIVNVNKEFSKLFGLPHNSFMEQPVQKITQDWSFKKFVERNLNHSFELDEEVKTEFELKIFNTIHIISVQVKPIYIDINTTYGLMVFDDISDHRSKEQHLYDLISQTQESDFKKSTIINNLLKEIRIPLNAIAGLSKMAYDKEKEQGLNTNNYMKHIENSSHNLSRLVDDVINVVKIDNDRFNFQKSMIKISDLIEDIKDYTEELAKTLPATLKIELNTGTYNSQAVFCDKKNILLVIKNFIDNAIRFTNHGKILVSIITENDQIKFSIKDSGIGIPEEEKDKIFYKFFSNDFKGKNYYKGSGLGLYIAKHIIEGHGSTIQVDSQPGEGSDFCFSLPLSKEHLPRAQRINGRSKDYQTIDANSTILIVEDTIPNYEYLKAALEKTNARILWAKDGRSALKYTEKSNPTLILMDIQLPDIHGVELTRKIRKSHPHIAIIAQTAYAEDIHKRGDIELFDAFLAKPISASNLIQTAEHIIAKKMINKEDLPA